MTVLALGNPATAVWDALRHGLLDWVAGAVGDLAAGVVREVSRSTNVNVGATWFAGPGSPYRAVQQLAASLMVLFLLMAVLQGLTSGQAMTVFGRAVSALPVAVLGMLMVTALVTQLIKVVDVASAQILQSGGLGVSRFFTSLSGLAGGVEGFAGMVALGIAVLALVFLWVELIVRSALIYLLVAFLPLGLAAFVWPAARGFLRKTVEVLLAVILSKLAIAIALAIGAAALGELSGGNGSNGTRLGGLLAGGVLVGLAAFSPFVVLRLVPVVEAAAVAHGVSRSPVRAASTTVGTVSQVQMMRRFAGGSAAGSMVSMERATARTASAQAASGGQGGTSGTSGTSPGSGTSGRGPRPSITSFDADEFETAFGRRPSSTQQSGNRTASSAQSPGQGRLPLRPDGER